MKGEPPSPRGAPGATTRAASFGSRISTPRRRIQVFLARTWANERQRWSAIGVASILLISIIAGIAYYWSHRDSANDEQDYVEIYLTDLPANFTRLEVRLAGVYVGEPNHTLQLLVNRFDLLSLQGPEDALKVASGHVPAGDHQAVRIVFHSARALLNGAWIGLQVPDQLLTVRHDFNSTDRASGAFLFDLDVEKSVHVEDGRLQFRPHVAAIYHHSFDTGESKQLPQAPLPTQPATFKDKTPAQPKDQELSRPTGSLHPTASSSPSPSSKFSWSPVPTTPRPTPSTGARTGSSSPAPSSSDPAVTTPPTDTEGYLPSIGNASSVPEDPGKLGGWFVRFQPTMMLVQDMADAVMRSWKGQPEAVPELAFVFGSEAAAYVFATPEQAWRMSMDPQVEYVEPDREIVTNLATSRTAIRLPQLLDPVLGLKDAQGRPLDGQGIGVGVIDLGFDGTHPDLPYRLTSTNPLLLVNYKVESLFTIDVISTDTTSGHGTHVLGILAGRGVADPSQRGVAPGVKAYGFGIGEGSTTLWPNTALDWLVQNHDKVNPPIKVVTNSWGSGNQYDPNSLTTRLVQRLVDAGVVVVFSAGNSGGDGSFAATTSQCQIPTPGVICVAAFDDKGTGTRDGNIAPYSSRGRSSQTSTWPDVSAPGTTIRSASPLLGTNTGIGLFDYYTELSGTSMAAPHVAGVVALMLQANPDLSPAQVESLIKQSAYRFAHGGSYNAHGHVAKGHGLVDAYAAVALAKQA